MADLQSQFNDLTKKRNDIANQIKPVSFVRGGGNKSQIAKNAALQEQLQSVDGQLESLLKNNVSKSDLGTAQDIVKFYQELADKSDYNSPEYNQFMSVVQQYGQVIQNYKTGETQAQTLQAGGKQATTAANTATQNESKVKDLQSQRETTVRKIEAATAVNDKNTVNLLNVDLKNIDSQISNLSGTKQVSPEVTNQISNVGGSTAGLQTLNAPVSTNKGGKGTLPSSGLDANGNLVSGKFTTKNGVLTQNGQAFTGQYNNQYYAAGKIETPAQVKQDFMDKYAVQAAFLASVPEFAQKGGLLDQAIAGNWSASKWKQAYQSSQWFQTNGATYATEEQDRLTAPGTYAANYNNLLDQMALTAKAEGIDISGFGGHITADQAKAMDPNSNPVAKLLQNYYTSAVPSNVLTTYLAKNGQIAMANGSAQGTLATTATSLRNYASQMGVASQFLSPTWSNAAGQQVAGSDYFTSAALAAEQGLTTADSVQANMRNVAANIYKPFAQQIKDGYSVSDLASPYTSAVANLLEVSPTSVDLGATTGYGSLVTKALQGDGTNPMNLDAFTTQVKQQPQWLNTKNARDSLMGTASTMLRNFGLVVGQ
jgi:hypothetical protein